MVQQHGVGGVCVEIGGYETPPWLLRPLFFFSLFLLELFYHLSMVMGKWETFCPIFSFPHSTCILDFLLGFFHCQVYLSPTNFLTLTFFLVLVVGECGFHVGRLVGWLVL
jgi:hypothetical protein